MAIVKRPAGEAEAYGQAGKAVGGAKRSAQARQEGARIAAEDRARQWEIEKMLYRSQQDFLHEQRMRQADLDAEARGKEWQVEKMELNSKLQFELENKRYIRDYEKYQSGLDEISKIRAEGNYPDSVIQMMEYTLNREFSNKIPEAASKLGINIMEYERQRAKAIGKKGVFDFGAKPTGLPTTGTTSNPLGLNITATPTKALPERIVEMEAQNKFRVISPNGNEEIIDAAKWSEYKAKGYLLAEVVAQQKRAASVRRLGEHRRIAYYGE